MIDHTFAYIVITAIGWACTAVLFIRKHERDRIKIEAEIDKRLSLLKIEHVQDVREMREKLDRCEREFHEHELMNEKQFEKYHIELRQDFDKVFNAIDNLRDMIMQMATDNKIKL